MLLLIITLLFLWTVVSLIYFLITMYRTGKVHWYDYIIAFPVLAILVIVAWYEGRNQ